MKYIIVAVIIFSAMGFLAIQKYNEYLIDKAYQDEDNQQINDGTKSLWEQMDEDFKDINITIKSNTTYSL